MTNQLTGQLVILALLVSAAAAVVAQDEGAVENDQRKHHDQRKHQDRAMRHEGGRMGNPERMLEMMQRHLDLDETQAQQLSNIVDAAKPEMDLLHTALRENREATRSLDTSDADYSVKLQNLSISNAELAGKMTLLHGRLRAEVHAVLTPEQLQMIEERGEHSRNRRHQRDSEEAIR